MKKYYAVRNGRKNGIYTTWAECSAQINGYSGAEYKGFSSLEEAKNYLCGKPVPLPISNTDDKMTAYVDGSFDKKTKRFSFGAVIICKGEEYYFKKDFSDLELSTMRNVAGEIKGAEFAMYYCYKSNVKNLDIFYDYEGIEKWCSGAWQANKKGTREYVNFYKKISSHINVNFIKVKGHSGDKYNDMADSLAKSALGFI